MTDDEYWGAVVAIARHDLAVLLLFAGPPTDRALAGWQSPLACWGWNHGQLAIQGRELAEVISEHMGP